MEKVTLTKDGITHTVSDEMFIRALKNEGFKTPEELAKDQPQENQPEELSEEETTEEQPEELADVKEGDE